MYYLCNTKEVNNLKLKIMKHKILPAPIEVKLFLALFGAAFLSILIQIIIK